MTVSSAATPGSAKADPAQQDAPTPALSSFIAGDAVAARHHTAALAAIRAPGAALSASAGRANSARRSGAEQEDVERLRAALAAEHAALFAYGRLGIHLDEPGKAEARGAETAHRARRDALIIHLDQVKASAVPADAGYALPFPVSDGPTALRLAVHVEEAVAATWRSALASTENELRRLAIDAYSEAAVRATRWRRIAGVTPVVATFPGRAG